MSLEQYAVKGANVAAVIEPLKSRATSLCEFFGGRLTISSGYRSFAEQAYLWNLYGAPRAAPPGHSNHELGLAVDFELNDGLVWAKVHAEAPNHGIHFPLAYEDWHAEAEPAWVPAPQPPEDDMTKEQFAAAIGATIAPDGHQFAGLICVPLINDDLNGTDLYPLASAISYTHQEEKKARLGG